MVALRGPGWTLAPSLQAMVAEANRIAPNRSKLSDGSIGDPAHRARRSDHNPSAGIVHALDLTHSPSRGWDAHARVRTIITRRDPRVSYVISNRRIYGPGSRYGWAGGPYTGINGHTSHAHVSVAANHVGRYDTSPWFAGAVPFPTPVIAPAPEITEPSHEAEPNPEDDDMIVLVHHPDGKHRLHYDSGTHRTVPGAEVPFAKLRARGNYLDLRHQALHGTTTEKQQARDYSAALLRELPLEDLGLQRQLEVSAGTVASVAERIKRLVAR